MNGKRHIMLPPMSEAIAVTPMARWSYTSRPMEGEGLGNFHMALPLYSLADVQRFLGDFLRTVFEVFGDRSGKVDMGRVDI